MTISVRGVNNAAGQSTGNTLTDTVATVVTTPASTANGDRVYIGAVSCTTNSLSANGTGWTQMVNNVQLGSGAVAAGSGLRLMSIWWRDKDASWSTMPTVSCTNTTNNSLWIGAIAVTPTAGSVFTTPSTGVAPNQTYNTATTAYTDSPSTFTSTSPIALYFTGLNDNVTSTTVTVKLSTTTVATPTEQCDGGTATGNDVSGKLHTYVGAQPVATSFNLTLSAASQGETYAVLQDEIAPGPAASTRTWDYSATDTTNWSYYFDTGAFTISSGQGVIASDGTEGNGEYVTTTIGYDTRGSYAGCQVVSAPTDPLISTFVGFGSVLSTGPYWIITGTTAGDENLAVTRTHVNGDYYRVRELSGTIYYEYSSGGGPWTTLTTSSLASYTNINSVSCTLWFGAAANSATSPANVVFDNFNIAPVFSTNTGFLALF